MMLSTVQIFAAGSENTESMELLIDAEVVQSWDTIGGNASTGEYQVYSFDTPADVTPGQIRVALPSDVYNPQSGIDENLRIDAIVIDGIRYETEASDVFSTGTWKESDGITPGFREDEFLHGAGYFQFADPTAGVTTDISVNASGSVGSESFDLQIDGATVRTWNNIGTEISAFTYRATGVVSADQIRVVFLNDDYDPSNGIDRNLLVDSLVVGGTDYATEAPEVFSTGTWADTDGTITPGFGRGNTLHANGYFQYSAATSDPTTLIEINALGDDGAESFALQVDGATVQTWNNIGTESRSFSYRASGVVTADQIRVVFLNDFFDLDNGIDRNLVVDDIVVGGIAYDTASPAVFSTGTWTESDAAVIPGFGRGNTLHSGGYFQYASETDPVSGGDFALEGSQFSVSEDAGSVILKVVRTGGSDGVVSIDYSTIDVSAIAGQDYDARSGTLVFADGETEKTVTVPILNDVDVEGDEQFAFVIDNLVGTATLLAPRTATVTIDDNDDVQSTGDGLLGEYFNSTNLTNRVATRIDESIQFDWGNGGPMASVGVDDFSIRWTGQIEALYSETYTFTTNSDDGIRLWVNDVLVIDKFIDQAATSYSGEIDLEAGIKYDIRMEYYERNGIAVAQLSWASASQAFEYVPQSQLYAADDPGPDPGDSLIAESVIDGLTQPTAIAFSPDGRNLYVSEKRGRVLVSRDGSTTTNLFIDISDQVNGVRDRGLLDIAIHPDFENNPYVYLLFTYDPPEVYDHVGHALAGPDKVGNRAGRLIRVEADASTDYTTAIAGSEVVLLGSNSTWDNFNAFANSTFDFDEPPAGILPDGTNLQDFISSDSESHTVGAVEFSLDGSLFVSIGDGASYNRMDPRAVRVQDIDNLSGKVLRIDPLTGKGLADNPFFNGDADANRSKVYHYGLRNPFRLAVDQSTGQLYVGDVGWTQWEEVNSAPAGANFGWPYYEGGNGVNLQNGLYSVLPEAQAFYSSSQIATPSIYGLSHSADGINAIVMGDVYRGTEYPAEYQGNLFVNDLGRGIVRAISFDESGNVDTVRTFTTGAQIVVQMIQGPDGTMYFVDLNDNTVGRWVFV